jgi:histidyl-tRNA synthetase
MQKIQALRGFRDIYGEEVEKFNLIEEVARKYFNLLGYKEIQIPTLEKTELFVRSIGDATDIVEKEMFSFNDRSGESLSMRPEATASVVRAYLQTGLYAKERISRLFTIGSMFRHERPQKGRFREFHQVDVEVFGIPDSSLDAELLWMIWLILQDLGVPNYRFEVNSVGCRGCRETFRAALVGYLRSQQENLCEDCKGRMERNPLRVFDCKSEQCAGLMQMSPLLFDHLCSDCRSEFEIYLALLDAFGVPVTVNKRLVRGLDYYTRAVFEVTSDDLGAQKAFVAGGRYDNLVQEIGGPATPGSGFAIGMERLALIAPQLPDRQQQRFFLAAVGEKAAEKIVPLLKAFVRDGMALSYTSGGRSLKSQMKYAAGIKADYVLILGDQELESGSIILRNMQDGSQRDLALNIETLTEEVRRSLAK